MQRREFLPLPLLGLFSSLLPDGRSLSAEVRSNVMDVSTRALTRGPRYHWFGYYDKLQFDPTNRFVLANETRFEHRSPQADDLIDVGMIDTQEGDRWIPLGTSRAWGWQQGCMLQWRPGSQDEVLWNDRLDDRFVCRVLNVQTGQLRTLPYPIYTVSPDGRWGLSVDFARINNLRPGYGYAGIPDPHLHEKAPANSGIWRVDMQTGTAELVISLDQICHLPHPGVLLRESWNYFNHLLISPDGERFVFLHRWREQYDPQMRRGSGFVTRMLTAAADGSDLYAVDPSGHTSHFIWRDPQHICAWTRPAGRSSGFYLFRDQTQEIEIVGQDTMTQNGHITYVPQTDDEWILNDTYPIGDGRLQTVYLYHVPSGRKLTLGRFAAPPEYTGEWRCDTHPRCSRDGQSVTIDSPHGGDGRQVYLLDIGPLIG